MIKDSIQNAALYGGISPLIKEAFDFLRSTDFAKAVPGRTDIRGGDLYAMYSINDMKPWDDGKLEAHDKYIDIQYVVSGREVIGCADRDDLDVTQAYDPDRDILFLSGQGDALTLGAGDFILLYPHDAHKPLILPQGAAPDSKSVKVVVKVRVSAL